MPFESQAQNRWAHTPEGEKALGGPSKVKEWENATDYSHLPEHTMNKGHLSKTASFAAGGSVLGRSRSFAKGGEYVPGKPRGRGMTYEPDGADQRATGFSVYKNPDIEDQEYGKGQEGDVGHGKSGGAPKVTGKVEKAVVPRR